MTHRSKKSIPNLSRRGFMAAAGASLVTGLASATAAPQLQLDGLYDEPWLFKTSGGLGPDFAEAAKSKRNFAILWEMRGCPWCKRLHLETFAKKDVAAYLQENFAMLQLNLRGGHEVADFDGTKFTEEDLSLKYGVNSTPTFQFFKPSDASRGQELGRAGYLGSDDLLMLLRFIRERGYENGTYDEWAKSHKNPA